jgi:methionyl-tRNA formyltransferase
MKIGYFADGPWSHRAFEKIINKDEIDINFICARFDTSDSVLRACADKHKIPFLIHPDINSEDFITKTEVQNCDLFVSMSFNQIFKKDSLSLPRLGTINCHAGKLPFYRGRNILNWVLINDENEFGVTVHYVDEGIDTGDIIKQDCFEINDDDDYSTLLNRAYVGCAEALSNVIDDFLLGRIKRVTQDSITPFGLYCCGRGQGDENINWNSTSREIFNFVRAICAPGPKARCFNKKSEVKINKVQFYPNAPSYKGIPGSVLAKHKGVFLVKTSDSYIGLSEWESSIPIRVGDRLK